jgi:hypothetical protein
MEMVLSDREFSLLHLCSAWRSGKSITTVSWRETFPQQETSLIYHIFLSLEMLLESNTYALEFKSRLRSTFKQETRFPVLLVFFAQGSCDGCVGFCQWQYCSQIFFGLWRIVCSRGLGEKGWNVCFAVQSRGSWHRLLTFNGQFCVSFRPPPQCW